MAGANIYIYSHAHTHKNTHRQRKRERETETETETEAHTHSDCATLKSFFSLSKNAFDIPKTHGTRTLYTVDLPELLNYSFLNYNFFRIPELQLLTSSFPPCATLRSPENCELYTKSPSCYASQHVLRSCSVIPAFWTVKIELP